jgi:hypothetical protein
LGEVDLLDEGVGPEDLHEFVFGDDAAAVAEEDEEGFEGFGIDPKRLTEASEEAADDVDPKLSKFV